MVTEKAFWNNAKLVAEKTGLARTGEQKKQGALPEFCGKTRPEAEKKDPSPSRGRGVKKGQAYDGGKGKKRRQIHSLRTDQAVSPKRTVHGLFNGLGSPFHRCTGAAFLL
jgi:hypothetical protein